MAFILALMLGTDAANKSGPPTSDHHRRDAEPTTATLPVYAPAISISPISQARRTQSRFRK